MQRALTALCLTIVALAALPAQADERQDRERERRLERIETDRKAEQRYWRSQPLHCDTATECARLHRLRGDGGDGR